MGNHPNITHDKFPKQSGLIGKEVEVIFHYDADHRTKGKIVRDDREAPFEMIIQLASEGEGPPRFVRSSECQYSG